MSLLINIVVIKEKKTMEFIDKVNWNLLDDYIKNGLIVANKHPEYDIWILNYSPKTHSKGIWDLYTLSCRGMIIDINGNILARPFQKFKNLEEYNPSEIDMSKKFEIFEKIDGSLIILFYYEKYMKWIVASKGLFISEQAIEATKMLDAKYLVLDKLNKTNTYLFEIIYPENRIVVDYGDLYELTLLAVINTKNGNELTHLNINKLYSKYFSIVKKYNINKINDLKELKAIEEENREGYVIKFEDGFRVKVKFNEYIRLHGILTNVSNVVVWEHMKNNYDFEQMLDKVPDEFYDWVIKTSNKLKQDFNEVERKAIKEFIRIYHINNITERKSFAMEALKTNYRSILFKMYDKRSYNELILKLIKPAYSRPFKDGYDSF